METGDNLRFYGEYLQRGAKKVNWVESAMWNEVLGITETMVITLCTWFFLSHTEQNVERKKKRRCAMMLLYWCGFTGISFGLKYSSYVNLVLPLFMVVMTVAAGGRLYNSKRIYLFYYFLFPVTVTAVQVFVGYLVLGYMFSRWGTIIFDYYLANTALLIRQPAVVLLTGVWVVLLNRRKYEDVKGIRFAGLLLPPVVSAFIIFSLICIGNVFMQLYGVFLIILDIFFLVIMNLYIWYLFSYQSKNKKLREELESRKKQSEMQYRYYERVERQYQSSRKMIHDMRNHLQAIETLKEQDMEKGKEYMKDMHQVLDSFALADYTDNRMLNIILNEKAREAKNQGIEMDIRIGEIDLRHIRDIDITTIFANLLDNAVEAAGRADRERKIQIWADMFHDFAAIKICNTVSLDHLKRKEMEKERMHMGIGLVNVRHTLDRYGGGMMTEEAEDSYTVNITIPEK